MKHPRHSETRLWVSLGIGLWIGLIGLGLLFAWAQCLKVEQALAGDIRLLALLAEGVDEDRLTVARERLMFQPDVASVEYISRERALEDLAGRDPDLARSAALLGDNPLPSAFEVRLTPEGLARLSAWLEMARKVPEIAAVEYRAAQVQAALQARADRRYLAVILSICFWGLALAAFYQLIPGFADPEHALRELGQSVPMVAWSTAGAAIGVAAALALALPVATTSPFWAWPPAWGLAAVTISGTLAGWIFDRLIP